MLVSLCVHGSPLSKQINCMKILSIYCYTVDDIQQTLIFPQQIDKKNHFYTQAKLQNENIL